MATANARHVYVWDMDETLVLFKSLCDGTYAQGFKDGKDVEKGMEIGRMWENLILQVCDDFFFYDQIDEYNMPFLDVLRQYDDGVSLSGYDFMTDGFRSLSEDSSRRKLAYRYRAIATRYEQGLGGLLDEETIHHWNELYALTDKYTDNWLSSARALLEQCSTSPEGSSGDSDGDTNLNHIHFLVTSGSLVPSLVKCLLFKLNDFIPHENIYSSYEVGKSQCFQKIKDRFDDPNSRFCVIGDGWEECGAAQAMQWPFVKINPHPDGPHRFPGLSSTTLGFYFDAVYGSSQSDKYD